jgi:protein-disulfide isomerase
MYTTLMSKPFWAIIAVIAVVFGGIIFFNNKNDSSGGKANASVQPTNHVEGKGTTGVTVVEYGDYQCPYCGQFYPFVKEAVAKTP